MHRTRLLAALASVSLVVGVAACGDDDDAGGDETVPALTADVAAESTSGAETTDAAESTVGAETTAASGSTAVETTAVESTAVETTVVETTGATDTAAAPETTVVETTAAPETTAVETTVVETTAAPETTAVGTTVAETTEVPETTVVETTVPETTAVETTAPETTEVPETTAPPETTAVETTEAAETTVGPETTVVETTLVETTLVPETTAAAETTVVGTTEAPDTTVAGTVPGSIPAIPEILPLSGEGLGLVTFGDDPDAAVAAVTEVLGAPTEDTGWEDPLSISACPGTQVRRVSWGALSLFFGDESPIESGTPHLFAYAYGSADDLQAEPVGLATDDGIGLGSTVAYLKAAYPDVVIEPGEDGVIEPSFFVDDTLSGRLTGGEDDDLVTVIIGGDPCGV